MFLLIVTMIYSVQAIDAPPDNLNPYSERYLPPENDDDYEVAMQYVCSKSRKLGLKCYVKSI
jgi:hypothetical protein